MEINMDSSTNRHFQKYLKDLDISEEMSIPTLEHDDERTPTTPNISTHNSPPRNKNHRKFGTPEAIGDEKKQNYG